MSIFGSEKIINIITPQDDLNIFYAGFDFGVYRYDELVDQINDVIVDFSYGFHDGILEDNYNRSILKEAAKSIYGIKAFQDSKTKYVDEDSELADDIEDKYLKRGEFGELILHLLLRDFHSSLPLLSKVYFKDTDGATVHGFDSVHIAPDLNDSTKMSLWLGESKLYKDGKAGVYNLTKDIEEHFNEDYLRREFALISKKKESYIALDRFKDLNKTDDYKSYLEEKDKWYDLLDEKNKLEDIISSVTVPMVCTYSSEVFNNNDNEDAEGFKDELSNEITQIKAHFDKHLKTPIPADINILLILFPVPSKKELVKKLHIKLDHLQNI